MKKVNPNQTYNVTFVEGRPSTLIKGRVINNCISQAWADLYYGVDTDTIDPVEAQQKMEQTTVAYIFRHVMTRGGK